MSEGLETDSAKSQILQLFGKLCSLHVEPSCKSSEPPEPKIVSSFLGRELSMATSLGEILSCLGLLFFSGVIVPVFFSRSKSDHLRFQSSPALHLSSFNLCK